jgi:polysaccharide biosynthesis/export protein
MNGESTSRRCNVKNIQRIAAFAALLAISPTLVHAQGGTIDTVPAVGASHGTGATNNPNYRIGPQDVLDVNVWKEPEVSRQVPVRPDGKISLPLLNDVQAAGLTPAELSAQITTGFEQFMTDPQVTVIVAEINSQRIYMLGEVARAGAYVLLPGMTVLQALSNAGGFTPFSNLKNIHVLRQENGKQIKLSFNYKEVISGKRTEQNIELKPGDTIVVP